MELFKHQQEALEQTKDLNRVAYYLDMGLGKTFVGAEKMKVMNSPVNLIVCQKSKIQDWIDHFNEHYAVEERSAFQKDLIFDLTNKKEFERFINEAEQATTDNWIQDELTGEYYSEPCLYPFNVLGVINYELAWRRKDLLNLLAILKGVFSMSTTDSTVAAKAAKEFLDKHVYNITANAGDDALVGAATLNKAIQKAGGDNKNIFKLVIMHSEVATNLENMKLLKYMTYTDADGIERELALATWNGRTVLVDDNMPTEDVAKAGDVEAYTAYTTYVLGEGAIILDDIGDAVPYEMSRDPKTNGGQDTLYVRDRYICGVDGISFEKPATITASASNTDLETGANWNIINDGTKAIPHKAIAIAKIVSKG